MNIQRVLLTESNDSVFFALLLLSTTTG